jgi:hypothetical protein
MNTEQYKLVFARRLAQNALLWQTPTIASAAQSVLLVASFNPQTNPRVSFVLACVAALVGGASIQLMAKHRHMEETDSRLLLDFEKNTEGFQALHGDYWNYPGFKRSWFLRLKSHFIWLCVLCALFGLSIYAAFLAYGKPFAI